MARDVFKDFKTLLNFYFFLKTKIKNLTGLIQYRVNYNNIQSNCKECRDFTWGMYDREDLVVTRRR